MIQSLVFSLVYPAFALGAVPQTLVKIARLGETIHLEFSGLNQWKYDIDKKNEKKSSLFKVHLPQLTNDAKEALEKSKAFGIDSVSFLDGADGGTELELKFNDKDMVHFDYLTDKPSRLVIDFFPAEKNSGKANVDEPKTKTPAISQIAAQKKVRLSKTSDRKPATADFQTIAPQGSLSAALSGLPDKSLEQGNQTGVFDGADPNFNRFEIQPYQIKEESIIASQQSDYVDFPALHSPPDILEILSEKMPIYNIKPGQGEENKMARLLLTLHQKKRHLVFKKTVEWFFEKYPKSEYSEIVQNMYGDTLFQVWLETQDPKDLDAAFVQYQQARKLFPESPLIERNFLVSSFALIQRGDHLGAIQSFLSYKKNFPKSINKDLADLGIAEAHYQLNMFDEATAQLNELISNGRRDVERNTARFMRPDVAFKRKDNDRAITEYREVIKSFPQESLSYPNAYLNLAAALFRKKNFVESLPAHLDFVRKFPSHPSAGFALTRVGELLEILGAEPQRVMGAFMETTFRYGDTEGAVVARLRLMSSKMKDMKPNELDKAEAEMLDLAKKSVLPKIDEFARLMVSEGYFRRKDFKKATDLLVSYYQANPTTANTELIQSRVVRNISDHIYELVEKGDFVSALKVHQEHAGSWLKHISRIDVRFNIGRAFEQGGVYKESEKLYRETLNRLIALKGTKAEKELSVFERIPKVDEVFLRQASVFFQEKQYQRAFDNLNQIENPAKLAESSQIERILLAGKLYDKKGEPETAIRYLANLIGAWKGVPYLVAEPYLLLGEIESRLKKSEEAIKSFKRVDQLMTDSGEVPASTHARALQLAASENLKLNRVPEAISALESLLDKYENKFPLSAFRYQLGRIYFDRNEKNKAAAVWKSLEQSKDPVWTRLAKENLKSQEWNEEYNKYLKRIPAMAKETKSGGQP